MNQADPQQAFEPKVIVEFEKGCGKPGGGGKTANRWVKEIYGMSRLCKTVSICNSMFKHHAMPEEDVRVDRRTV